MQPERADMTSKAGRSPSGRATHERSHSSVSPPPVGVPNAVHLVSVMLSKHDGNRFTQTMTQSWSAGQRDAAIVRALDYAKQQKPGFAIDQWLVADIPLPVVALDDGATTAPRYAAELVRLHEPGRHGLIDNLERLADHLDACNASAIEARQRTDPEEGLDPKGESAGPQDIAQGPSQ